MGGFLNFEFTSVVQAIPVLNRLIGTGPVALTNAIESVSVNNKPKTTCMHSGVIAIKITTKRILSLMTAAIIV